MKGALKMTADFSTKKVDLSKVSNAVKKVVSNIAKTEGSKKKIDTEKEFCMLSQYLAGNSFSMTNDEIGYIEGFMIDYQKSKQKEFEEDSVTQNTKKEVSKIAKRMGDKKKIDTDEEAQALALLLKNTHNDLNLADKVYIQNLLLNSGYANYLRPDEPSVTVVNIVVQENVTNNNDCKNTTAEETPQAETFQTETIPSKGVQGHPSVRKAKPKRPKTSSAGKEADRAAREADRSRAEADRSRAEADRSAKEADRSKAEADRAKQEADKAEKLAKAPKVSEAARAKGFGIASKVQEELHDTWTNNGTIRSELSRLDSSSAYSFVGKMLEITDDHNVFGSFYKRVPASNVAHVIRAFLGQAKNIGLQKDPAYIKLVETYKFLKRQYVDKSPNDPIYDSRDIEQLDIQVKNLYTKMSQIYK